MMCLICSSRQLACAKPGEAGGRWDVDGGINRGCSRQHLFLLKMLEKSKMQCRPGLPDACQVIQVIQFTPGEGHATSTLSRPTPRHRLHDMFTTTLGWAPGGCCSQYLFARSQHLSAHQSADASCLYTNRAVIAQRTELSPGLDNSTELDRILDSYSTG
mgnify:CR=1 FL=1